MYQRNRPSQAATKNKTGVRLHFPIQIGQASHFFGHIGHAGLDSCSAMAGSSAVLEGRLPQRVLTLLD